MATSPSYRPTTCGSKPTQHAFTVTGTLPSDFTLAGQPGRVTALLYRRSLNSKVFSDAGALSPASDTNIVYLTDHHIESADVIRRFLNLAICRKVATDCDFVHLVMLGKFLHKYDCEWPMTLFSQALMAAMSHKNFHRHFLLIASASPSKWALDWCCYLSKLHWGYAVEELAERITRRDMMELPTDVQWALLRAMAAVYARGGNGWMKLHDLLKEC